MAAASDQSLGYEPLALSRLLFGSDFLFLPGDYEVSGHEISALVVTPSDPRWLSVGEEPDVSDWWGVELGTRLILEHSAVAQHGHKVIRIPVLKGIPRWRTYRPIPPGATIEAYAFIEDPKPDVVSSRRTGFVQLRHGSKMLATGEVFGCLVRQNMLGFGLTNQVNCRSGTDWSVDMHSLTYPPEDQSTEPDLIAGATIPQSPFWAGRHFNGKAIAPGSVILSYAAKALAGLAVLGRPEEQSDSCGLSEVRNWQVLDTAEPKDRLRITADRLEFGEDHIGGLVVVSKATAGGQRDIAKGYVAVRPRKE